MKISLCIVYFVMCFSIVALASEPKAILVTPSAPKFTDAERQTELAKRRNAVLAKMQSNSILILWSATPRNYAGDVDFLYRQENNHYYLTNLKQNGSTLVLVKEGEKTNEYLFLPKRNPQTETWNGKMYSNEEATRISGIKNIIDSTELQGFLQAVKEKKSWTSKSEFTLANNAANLYLLLPEEGGDAYAPEYTKEAEFSKSVSNYKVENARSIFDALRLVKSPFEIKLLQHAIDITTEAQMRAMGVIGKANWEYEVHAEVDYTFRRRNADYWGYPSIVGCGPNATTLHYVESQSGVKKGDLMLMDVGAEYDHYTADVTRTFPVNGKFTKEQAEIYQIVLDAQEAAAKVIKPGGTFGQATQASQNVLAQGLLKLGLITELRQARMWTIHGWGHWLGMNVHDVGDYALPFQKGMVMTNEPGIYIRGDALDYFPNTPESQALKEKIKPAFEKYKNIGVRIEDDMLVTENGVEWMTKKLPRKIEDVEAFMEKAKIEMQSAEIQKIINPTYALFTKEKTRSF